MAYKKKNKKQKEPDIAYKTQQQIKRDRKYYESKETWKFISGYEPAYQVKVSSHGRVIILPEVKEDTTGRKYVTLAGRDIPIDLLVAQAFIPNKTNSEMPIHKNGDLSDNNLSNLTWARYTKDPDAPGRMFSTLSMLTYILHPNILADRDKEFTKFYTYLEYLWRSGQLPVESEQLIMDGYDMHKKRVIEDWEQRNHIRVSAADASDIRAAREHTEQQSTSSEQYTPSSQSEQFSDSDKDTFNSILDSVAESQFAEKTDSSSDSSHISFSETESNSKSNNTSSEPPVASEPEFPLLPHPFMNIPEDMLASALVDLYERVSEAASQPGSDIPTIRPADIPELIAGAMRRVMNVPKKPGKFRLPAGYHRASVSYRSRLTKRYFFNLDLDPKVLLEDSLTAPYHLNMCPQLPPIKEQKKIQPTQHIQSMIYDLKKTGKFPDWAKESVLEALTKLLTDEDCRITEDTGDVRDNNTDNTDNTKNVINKETGSSVSDIQKINKNLSENPVKTVKTDSSANDNNISVSDNKTGSVSESNLSDNQTVSGSLSKKTNATTKVKKTVISADDMDWGDEYGAPVVTSVKKLDSVSGTVADVAQSSTATAAQHSTETVSTNPLYYHEDIPADTAALSQISENNKLNSVTESGLDSLSNTSTTKKKYIYEPHKRDKTLSGHDMPDVYKIRDEQIELTGEEDWTESGTTVKNIELSNGENSLVWEYRSIPATGSYTEKNGFRYDELGFKIHPERLTVFSPADMKMYRLPEDINTYPEFDSEGRPLANEYGNALRYEKLPEIPVNTKVKPDMYHELTPYGFIGNAAKKYRLDKLKEYVKNENRRLSGKMKPEEISELYDPEKDVTLGGVVRTAGLEESSYYNQYGQKVYHNVRYGEVYDPEKHTLFIPEMYQMPDMFNARLQKKNYTSEYMAFLMKKCPEIGDPLVLKRYYETAVAAQQMQKTALPNTHKNALFTWERFGRIAVRGWMPDGECMTFDSVRKAVAATGISSKQIADCCRGIRLDTRGIRWEFVDLADMDTIINRYMREMMEFAGEDIETTDWTQFMTENAKKRFYEQCEKDDRGVPDMFLQKTEYLREKRMKEEMFGKKSGREIEGMEPETYEYTRDYEEELPGEYMGVSNQELERDDDEWNLMKDSIDSGLEDVETDSETEEMLKEKKAMKKLLDEYLGEDDEEECEFDRD